MAALRIIWSETVWRMLERMFAFYNERNGSKAYSRSIYREIRSTLKRAAIYPYMYRATSLPDVRVFCCDNFKLFYRVLPTCLLVEAVCDARQDVDESLLFGKEADDED